MKRLPIVVAVLLAVAGCAAGCGDGEARTAQPQAPTTAAPPSSMAPSSAAAPASQQPVVLPPDPVPARDGACPYLETSFVADTNGQRVSKVRLSAGEPHPACFFYRADGGEQLRVQVLTGIDPVVAKAVVDNAAPVASSDPASLPGGWEGGKQPTDTGAVFAVARAGTAVVVVTNQRQTIKASRIAERAISALGL